MFPLAANDVEAVCAVQVHALVDRGTGEIERYGLSEIPVSDMNFFVERASHFDGVARFD